MKNKKCIIMIGTIIFFIIIFLICSGWTIHHDKISYLHDNRGGSYYIVKINHHEYIRLSVGSGICHYEDCEYCLKQNLKDKK